MNAIDTQIKLEQLTWQSACSQGNLAGMDRASERLEQLNRVRLAAVRTRAIVKGVGL